VNLSPTPRVKCVDVTTEQLCGSLCLAGVHTSLEERCKQSIQPNLGIKRDIGQQVLLINSPGKLENLVRWTVGIGVALDHLPDAVTFVCVTRHCPHVQLIDWNDRLEPGSFRTVSALRVRASRHRLPISHSLIIVAV